MAARGIAKDAVAFFAFADVAGAGVDADHQVRGRIAHARKRVGGVVAAVVVPAVFADQQAHLRAADAQHLGHIGARLEVAAFVKDVVGGQQLFVVLQSNLARLQHQQTVVQTLARAARGRGRAHDPVRLRQRGRRLLQRRKAGRDALLKSALLEQVAWVVAAQRKLAEHDQIGLRVRRLLGRGHHVRCVAFDVADGEIELGKGDA